MPMSILIADDAKCPCFSGKTYRECCQPYLQGDKSPESPLSLLRSRNAAYASGNIEYIERTMRDKALLSFNPNYTRKFTQNFDCIALEIIHSKVGSLQALIEYKAVFKNKNTTEIESLHQYGFFNRVCELWYYTNEHVVD